MGSAGTGRKHAGGVLSLNVWVEQLLDEQFIRKNMNTNLIYQAGRLALCLTALFEIPMTNAQSAGVWTDHLEYYPTEPIVAFFAGGPGNKKDWVGVYSEGQNPGGPASTIWNYVDGTRGGNTGFKEGGIRFNTGLNFAGVWEVYFLENDGYTQLAKNNFTVVDPSAPLVRADKTSYQPGETISISFTKGPGAAKDWIGVYKEGQVPGDSGVNSTIWNYVDGTKNGTSGKADGKIVFTGGLQAPGRYLAYLLANDGYTILAREPISVMAASAGEAPRIVSVEPANLSLNLPPVARFTATVRVGDVKVNAASVVLKLDGVTVTHQLQEQGTDVVISYVPSTLLAPSSQHTYSLSFADTTGRKIEQSAAFVVAAYPDIRLQSPLFLETFDQIAEGALPAGWVAKSFSEVQNEELDFGNLDSAAYAGWTTVNVDRFKGSFVTYSNPDGSQGEKDDYKRVLSNSGMVVVNGKLVADLASGRMLFGNSGYRRGRSQVMFLTTSDYNLSGKTDIHLSFHSLWEQNQDSIAVVEYSIDKGATWKPVSYFLAAADVKRAETGAVDVEATFNTEYGDVARYTDEAGTELGGTFGAFLAATIEPSIGAFVHARVDDSPVDGKRVELFRLAGADNQKTVRFRLAHAGTDSWYWGIDDFGIYSLGQVIPPSIRIARTADGVELSWGADAAGFTLESSGTVAGGTWTPVSVGAGSTRVVVPVSGTATFYRFKR